MLISFDACEDGTLLSKTYTVDGVEKSQFGFKTPIDGLDENGNPDGTVAGFIFVPNPHQPECPDDAEILGYTPHE